ncbi:MAG: DUF975 family protein [Lachnospiraceae bacterium]|nr:DUF975 family protein [Lachnospiraceae bacterium]
MWTRKELKQKAKEALKRNYWKIVLVSALLILLGGGSGSVGSGFSFSSGNAYQNNVSTVADVENGVDVIETESGNFLIGQYETEDTQQIQSSEEDTQTTIAIDQEPDHEDYIAMVVLAVAVFAAVFIVLFVIIFAVQVFLCNPLIVGTDRFMLKSIDDKAEVKEIAYGFDHSYLNIVKTLFFRDLYIFLWSLLFIIPGIYKMYQYRMVSYIAAEHPEMNYKEVLQLSKDMMNGEKWHAFVLDLSFIPWHILGVITCGILEIFYIAPYQNLTNACLYRTLCTLHEQADGQGMIPMLEDVETENR